MKSLQLITSSLSSRYLVEANGKESISIVTPAKEDSGPSILPLLLFVTAIMAIVLGAVYIFISRQ
jgi:hypothetical protein